MNKQVKPNNQQKKNAAECNYHTYKWAMVIHVHHAHFTRSAVMCSGGLWFITVCTKSIVLKIPFPNHGIAAPPNVCWCACRFKRGQAIACDGK